MSVRDKQPSAAAVEIARILLELEIERKREEAQKSEKVGTNNEHNKRAVARSAFSKTGNEVER